MKKLPKAHSKCEFVAVLKLWNVCKEKSPEWTKAFLGHMAADASEELGITKFKPFMSADSEAYKP